MSDYRLEQNKRDYEELLGLINKNVDLKMWGFVQTYSRIVADTFPLIIYDNQWCRVRFEYNWVDYAGLSIFKREAKIRYGRLHATNDGGYILGPNEKKAIGWHALRYYVINFLDNLSPQEVVDGKGRDPRVINKFERTGLAWVLPEESRIGGTIVELRLHNRIWEYYGQKLFDVFDLRNPELWIKYVQFHNEIKRLRYEAWKAKEKIGKPFKRFDDFEPDELW